MKKWTGVFVLILGILLFTYAMIARPYERNYTIDEEAGMKNIVAKINDLTADGFVYKLTISSQREQGDMDFLTLFVVDTKKETHQKIKFNRSGAFLNSVDREELDYSSKEESPINVLNLFNVLNIIDECKERIPDGYKYRHTEYVSVNNNRMDIRIAVTPEGKDKVLKNKCIHQETYIKTEYSAGRRGQTRTRTVQRKYYIMKFNVDKNGKVSCY